MVSMGYRRLLFSGFPKPFVKEILRSLSISNRKSTKPSALHSLKPLFFKCEFANPSNCCPCRPIFFLSLASIWLLFLVSKTWRKMSQAHPKRSKSISSSSSSSSTCRVNNFEKHFDAKDQLIQKKVESREAQK